MNIFETVGDSPTKRRALALLRKRAKNAKLDIPTENEDGIDFEDLSNFIGEPITTGFKKISNPINSFVYCLANEKIKNAGFYVEYLALKESDSTAYAAFIFPGLHNELFVTTDYCDFIKNAENCVAIKLTPDVYTLRLKTWLDEQFKLLKSD